MSEPSRPISTDLVSHTPGPWDIQSSRTTVTVRSAGSGEVISSWYAGHPTGTVTHANARLIAAAPELFAALQSCVDVLMVGAVSERDRALAAIAKAKGVTCPVCGTKDGHHGFGCPV